MIRNLLFGKPSPYAGFDLTPHPEDLQGWGSDDPILTEAIRAIRPKTVCEVGSWKGRSAINMAAVVKELGLDTEIVCVDTWLGSPEHWLRKKEPNHYPSLLIEYGRPQIYYTFLANVLRAGADNIITPFPNTSDTAAVIFAEWKVRFDLIYIDGAHEYEAVKRDIANYFELLSDDGLLIGDDYSAWPGVTQAADEFAGEHKVPLFSRRNKFMLAKGSSARTCIGIGGKSLMPGLRVLLTDPLPNDPAEALTDLTLEKGRIDAIIYQGDPHPAVQEWAHALGGVTLISVPSKQHIERYKPDLTL